MLMRAVGIALVLFSGFLFRAYQSMIQAMLRRAHAMHQKKLIAHFSWYRQWTKYACVVVALACIWYGLTRPKGEIVGQQMTYEGRDVLIALDISRSMCAQDIKPSRLEYSKKKIQALISALQADRVGLMIFAGDALVQCPLTRDRRAFSLFLDDIDQSTLSAGTTRSARAIEKAADIFDRIPSQAHPIVVLVTDGEDFSEDVERARSRAAERGIKIIILGIGTEEGAPIPLYDEDNAMNGHLKDASGKVVITRLERTAMENLARSTGGYFVETTKDAADISEIVREIQRTEGSLSDEGERVIRDDLFHWYAGAAGLLLLLEWIL